MNTKDYAKAVQTVAPKSPKFKDFFCAFTIGGAICVIGELLSELYQKLNFSKAEVKMLVPVTLIFIAVVLTALKLFDNIAKHAGAGTLVPITGFANAVSSPAMEFKSEGHILGIGVKMFTIAGPVILYGTAASVIYGVFYWLFSSL